MIQKHICGLGELHRLDWLKQNTLWVTLLRWALEAQSIWMRQRSGILGLLVSFSPFTSASDCSRSGTLLKLVTAQNFPRARERLDELRKSGNKATKSRERLSRSQI